VTSGYRHQDCLRAAHDVELVVYVMLELLALLFTTTVCVPEHPPAAVPVAAYMLWQLLDCRRNAYLPVVALIRLMEPVYVVCAAEAR